MAETRQIGRVNDVDVILRDRVPHLAVRFKLADGTGSMVRCPASRDLLRDYLDVWGVDGLQGTLSLLCWVTVDEGTILSLAPLMPDEGSELSLRGSAVEAAPAGPEAPAKKPAAESKGPPWPGSKQQWMRWTTLSRRAGQLGIDTTLFRPTAGTDEAAIEGLLGALEATIAEEVEKAKAAA